MNGSVYYLPGRGGLISTGLGEGLISRGWSVTGRETTGTFRELSFQQQIDVVCDDLTEKLWREDAHVIAVSYGAYLFLHAQAKLLPYVGKVLLLSPIVGQFSSEDVGIGFVPPRAKKLREMAEAGTYPSLQNCEIHVGSEDWQSNPENVKAFADKVGIPVTIVPGAGHQLGKEYVGALLDRCLSRM
jgi:alpha-beta hydrolase superfamily lysophospholipase